MCLFLLMCSFYFGWHGAPKQQAETPQGLVYRMKVGFLYFRETYIKLLSGGYVFAKSSSSRGVSCIVFSSSILLYTRQM